MSSTFFGLFFLGCLVFILIAAVGGVLRRKAGLRDAQALAPGDFVFRFSTFGEFGEVLPKLPRRLHVASPAGTSRVGAVSANSEGLTLWQVKTGIRLARLDWSAVTAVRPGTTTYPLITRSYPTLYLDVVGEPDGLSLPLLSANAHYFWRRTSPTEVEQIADKLAELRTQVSDVAEG